MGLQTEKKNGGRSKAFLVLTLAFCVLLTALAVYLSVGHRGNDQDPFAEPVLTLSAGWTLTDSAGQSRAVTLPATIDYGTDGRYTLSCTLPAQEGLLVSPALEFYSNYVDIAVSLDGHLLYSYPQAEAAFSGATGNTYHFVRLPADYAGETLTVDLRCQLGDGISYLLKPPLLGAKGTMLRADVMESLPSILLGGCMMALAIGLTALYLTLRQRLRLNNATIFTALFAMLFAVYAYCETVFAQLITPNGYLLCFVTLTLLALMPLPLIGVFMEAVSRKFRPLITGLMLLCSLNLIVQLILNFTGVMSIRVLVPVTHTVIIITIVVMALCLFFSDRTERPSAHRTLLSAIPMLIGGTADIILISLERPSINNSFWFTLGVTAFIVLQFSGFVRSYFALYHSSLESRLLRDMAYRDTLTNIGNRNAYERFLKELSAGPLTERLCCIVLDINDLKQINDTLGHQAGDTAIVETGKLLSELMPDCAKCFRTGGDEFIILLDGCDDEQARMLAEWLVVAAELRGRNCAIPLTLAVGYGHYEDCDGNINDFIRRVDSLMYECKRRFKNCPLPAGQSPEPPEMP